ncbi:MAG: thymidine phosphorylase [Chloroflexota bacterium]
MSIVDIIARKRAGEANTPEELDLLVRGVTSGAVPDYQIAAWLMAVCIRGMTEEETAHLTQAMARSGEVLDLRSRWPNVVDKHSTGGVGDKTTLVLAPMLAAAGFRVAKMSGRGLGFSGGTLDKLESIPGFRTELSSGQFLDQVERIGIAICGQSASLAPADGRLYALRDVTATVDSVPLIASSVMSKKLALRASRLVLDVKVGSGAFMKTLDQARHLARLMVSIGQASGVYTVAVISEMEQPEGFTVGNALEVREAVATLRGQGPGDVLEVCLALGRELGARQLEATISSGAAFEKLLAMTRAQGGDAGVLEHPERLPAARRIHEVAAQQAGCVAGIDAEAVARAAVALGAGRMKKGDPIDHAVGVLLKAKVGDRVETGQPLAQIHLNDDARLPAALALLEGAYRVSDQAVIVPGTIKDIIKPS